MLLAAVLAAALMRSEAGTRWVIDQAQTVMGDSLAIEAVEGNLGDRLTLKGVSYSQPGMQLDVASVGLAWHPAALLGGTLQVAELRVSGLQVQLLETDETPSESTAFDIEALRPPVDISLAKLAISDLAVVLPDGTRSPHQVKEGDRVLFSSYAGSEVVVDDEELLIMSEDDILAILD